jgi:hypothetical protein
MTTATATASREALASIGRNITDLQSRILQAIKQAGERGLTDEEGMESLGMNPSTYRGRRAELQEMGCVQIHPEGNKQLRRNATGRRCTVFVAKEVAQ